MHTINFIPETLQLARQRRQRIRTWATLALVALTVLAVPAALLFYREKEVAQLHHRRQQINQELTALRAELGETATRTDRARLHLERARTLRNKRAWSTLLAHVGQALPGGCWLTTLATDPPFPARTAAAKPSAPVRVSSAHRSDRTESNGPKEQANILIDAPRGLTLTGYALDSAAPYEFVAALKELDIFDDVALEQTRAEPGEVAPQFRFELRCTW